jgi:hypothetical protein
VNPPNIKTTYVYIGSILLTLASAISFLFAGASEHRFALYGVPLDDVWIHQVYARSMAEGHPFEYNPGEPETGSTSPLWVALLAPAHVFGLPINLTAKGLCIIFTMLTSITGYKLARAAGMNNAGYLFAFGFPLTPYLSFAAVSGTEVPLFMFLSFVTILLILSNKFIMAGIASGFTILARPEGYIIVLLFLASVIVDAYFNRSTMRLSFRSLAKIFIRFIIPIVIILAPWIIFCISITGKPFPMTFYVKAHWYGFINLDQFTRITSLLSTQPLIGADIGSSALSALAFVLGIIVYIYGLNILKHHSITAFIIIGFLGPVYLYAASLIVPLGDPLGADRTNSVQNFYFARYLIPGFAPILFVLTVGLTSIIKKKSRLTIVLVFIILMLTCVSVIRQHIILRNVYSLNCQNVEELQVRTAQWISENIPVDATVAVSDAGAIRYFGHHRIIDLWGLNTHRLLKYIHAINETSTGNNQSHNLLENFWQSEHPDYLAITRGWHTSLINNYRFEFLHSFTIDNNTICGGNEILIVKPHTP